MRRHRPAPPHVPAIVVTYLGRIAAIATLISGFLVWRVVETSAGSQQAADAAVIGVVMAFIAISTGCLTALGAILASTRGSAGEPGAAPLNANVVNSTANPVPTDPQPEAPAGGMPDPDGADPGVLEPTG